MSRANFSEYPTKTERARAFRELADDLDNVEKDGLLDGLQPCAVHTNWKVTATDAVCLMGYICDHPDFGDGPIVTAEVFCCNLGAGFARTYTGWLRLEEPAAMGDDRYAR